MARSLGELPKRGRAPPGTENAKSAEVSENSRAWSTPKLSSERRPKAAASCEYARLKCALPCSRACPCGASEKTKSFARLGMARPRQRIGRLQSAIHVAACRHAKTLLEAITSFNETSAQNMQKREPLSDPPNPEIRKGSGSRTGAIRLGRVARSLGELPKRGRAPPGTENAKSAEVSENSRAWSTPKLSSERRPKAAASCEYARLKCALPCSRACPCGASEKTKSFARLGMARPRQRIGRLQSAIHVAACRHAKTLLEAITSFNETSAQNMQKREPLSTSAEINARNPGPP